MTSKKHLNNNNAVKFDAQKHRSYFVIYRMKVKCLKNAEILRIGTSERSQNIGDKIGINIAILL